MKPIVILFAIFVISEAALPLPSYINPCSQNDPELNQCFETNANDAIPYLAQGDSEYNVPTLMPHLKWRDLLEVHMPPVTLILIDNDVYGLENFTVSNPNIDLDRRAIAMTLTSPLITWKAKYQIELEVGGFSPSEKVEGNIIISFPNGVYDVSVEYEFMDINGLQFANVTNAFAQFENMDVSFHFIGSTNYITTCSRNDPNLSDCFANSANLAMEFIAQGDKNYDIHTLRPMNFQPLINVDLSPIKLKLLDVIVYGTDNMTIIDPMIDFKSKKLEFTFTNPLIIWESKYIAIVEEVLLHKIEGFAKIYFRDGKFRMLFEYELNERNGLEYANIIKYDTDFLAVKMDYDMGQLASNPIIQNKWKKARNNFLTKDVSVACGEVVSRYINKVFNAVPFKNVFTE